jgi:hypothetical protein
VRVIIRWKAGPRRARKDGAERGAVAVASALLTPAAAMAAVIGILRIASDLHLAGSFVFVSGFFSHWQVWLGAAALLQLCSRALNRYGARSGRASTS